VPDCKIWRFFEVGKNIEHNTIIIAIMKIVVDYLKKDLGKPNLTSWDELRRGYLERAANIVKDDWQSPSYLTSLTSQAGRREGRIIGNISDYTRDQHDLSLAYEKKYAKEYLPRIGILPIEPYVTSSGMAALTTILVMFHRAIGVDVTVLAGKHSYFQNLEILTKSFAKVILFDENDESEWKELIEREKPKVVFVDSLCNESSLTKPPVTQIAEQMSKVLKTQSYLVVDNSMMATKFEFKSALKYRSSRLGIIGFESLNKYHQFGLDRVTGGIVWGNSIRLSVMLNQARRHAGTIMPDISALMLPTPNIKIMRLYLDRIWENREILQKIIGERCIGQAAQVVIKFENKISYEKIQKIIKKIIARAKKEKVQIVAGTSFGMPNTRIYLTARQSEFTEMFLRVSVGTEEIDQIEKIADIIKQVVG